MIYKCIAGGILFSTIAHYAFRSFNFQGHCEYFIQKNMSDACLHESTPSTGTRGHTFIPRGYLRNRNIKGMRSKNAIQHKKAARNSGEISF